MHYRRSLFTMLAMLLLAYAATAQQTQHVPAFQHFVRYDNGDAFTVDSLSKTGVNVLIFYDPGCGHCQELGYDVSQKWNEWSANTSFYFVSMVDKASVDQYVDKYGKALRGKPNVTFLHDGIGEFITLFDPQNFPSTYIYAADTGKLIQAYDGENSTENMRQHIAKE